MQYYACRTCSAPIERTGRRGRPRQFCDPCAPQGGRTRQKVLERHHELYGSDPEYTERTKRKNRQRYHADSNCREQAQRRGQAVTAARLDRVAKSLVEQEGKCAACHRPLDITDAHEDHDHSCCKKSPGCHRCYRGLLHGNCNTSLGLASDDPEVLRSLADYLDRTKLNA